MARNGGAGRVSAEREGRSRRPPPDAAFGQHAGGEAGAGRQADHEPRGAPAEDETTENESPEDNEGGVGDPCRGGLELGGGQGRPVPDTHEFRDSAGLTLTMTVMFLLSTAGMSEQLPWREYLIATGVGYAVSFTVGFMAERWWPAAARCRPPRRPGAGSECRLAILFVVCGFMVHGLWGGGAHPGAGWEPPLLWVPAILIPVIGAGGTIDGALLGEIASGLRRRTPWHALRFVLLERRRLAVGRQKP